MEKKPVIGLTVAPDTIDADYGLVHRYRLSADYSLAVEAAGGVPIMLPLRSSSIATVLDLVDGLLFSGGADIDPAHYGDNEVHPTTYGIDEERDTYELELIRAAIARDIPVLCICRGIQLLNVAFGGSLIQDIADQQPAALPHRQQKSGIPATQPSHDVNVRPGSLLERVYEVSTIPANSLHHQSVRQLGAGLSLDGQTADGIVEAISYPGASFVLAVQWHPEMMHRADPLQMKPFQSLIAAAQEAKLAASG